MKLGNKGKELQEETLANATTALVLLKEWLSISESQICSTEVLSEHLPKVNSLLESSMDEISSHFGNVADNVKEIEKELSTISDNVDIITIDGSNVAILEHITTLAKNTSDAKTAEQLNKLVTALQSHELNLHAEIKKTQSTLTKNAAELSSIVVGMQFQDRVSQNILITINIMKAISSYLDQAISESLPNVTKQERRKLLNMEFAKDLLKQFRLGELQHSFVDHLVNHGYISSAEDIGFFSKDHVGKQSSDDDVELF